MSVEKGETASPLFQALALISSNLFSVDNVAPVNPQTEQGVLGVEDVSLTTSLSFLVDFTPGVDSVGFPTIKEDSILNRDQVLTTLKDLGADMECNVIFHRNPLPRF
jgi:hypothetical protein